MGAINYHSLSILVVDDFSSFRSIVNGMLQDLGAHKIDMVSSGEDALELCEGRQFDVILSDYNLGNGRSGQHLLEELRFRQYITRRTVFIMVSAEASRNIVMSAYDCEPDDYLMKPITAHMLEKRMERLLVQRKAFRAVYGALEKGQEYAAIDMLIDMSLADNRHALVAQKMLGELFIAAGELKKAEKLYTRALEVRPLDWARLGLAKVKQLAGELDLAGEWLEKIVAENPLFLPAYDTLKDNWVAKGDEKNAQKIVERAVEVSPMSILRQKNLAELSQTNEDYFTSLKARRSAISLGRLSCYGGPDDSMCFARTVNEALEKQADIPLAVAAEAVEHLQHMREQYTVENSVLVQTNLLAAQMQSLQGHQQQAQEHLFAAELAMEEQESDIDLEIERVLTLRSLGDEDKAQELLTQLQERFRDDQAALEKLDHLLDEPVSESNLAMVAEVNREGIALYSAGRYDEALTCFGRAREKFPKHVGLLLNIVQAMVSQLKSDGMDDDIIHQCWSALQVVAEMVDPEHEQFSRFQRLKSMVQSLG